MFWTSPGALQTSPCILARSATSVAGPGSIVHVAVVFFLPIRLPTARGLSAATLPALPRRLERRPAQHRRYCKTQFVPRTLPRRSRLQLWVDAHGSISALHAASNGPAQDPSTARFRRCRRRHPARNPRPTWFKGSQGVPACPTSLYAKSEPRPRRPHRDRTRRSRTPTLTLHRVRDLRSQSKLAIRLPHASEFGDTYTCYEIATHEADQHTTSRPTFYLESGDLRRQMRRSRNVTPVIPLVRRSERAMHVGIASSRSVAPRGTDSGM
ncbi:hypothetical protein EXIGLDRAFT_524340 [Exidia glandulosa HHB12029]|uniref:Uncharacterized protein n=1 Tax=Exidia glandulosa HHB12029 TaxID=1314781 RepID=A0A165J1K2_EXIGL|nr:hypothetical protein EXIGLDRAFT_524340 [Exidia glandulosa HHB12029]